MNQPVGTYIYKASLIGSAHRFELTDAGLAWHIGGKSGVWPYAGISQVRLSYRPVSMQARRFHADIDHVSGARIALLSTTWTTVTLMAPQDRDYRAFITQLHRRLKEAGSTAELVGGLRPALYHAAVVVPAMVAVMIQNGGGDAQGSQRGLEYDTMSGRYTDFVETEVFPLVQKNYGVTISKDPEARAAIGGLLIRALSTGEWAGALFLLGFAALFWWQIGGFVRRNRPQRYGFDALPEELLP